MIPVVPDEIRQGTLQDLLSNHLILCHTVPYLPVADLLNLGATSQAFRNLIYNTPQAFRHLDLTEVKSAQFDIPRIDHGGETWRNVQLDENLAEDDFYSGPLRGIINNLVRAKVLLNIQTLILDGLAVTYELVHEILTESFFNIRVLSLRDAKHLNERLLCGALKTACRASRPEGTPKLKALYIFTPRERAASGKPAADALPGAGTVGTDWNARSQAALSTLVQGDHAGEGDAWYTRKGKMLTKPISHEWANTLQSCHGVMAFDAVLCNSPRHTNSPAFGKVAAPMSSSSGGGGGGSSSGSTPFAVATHSVGGCHGCGTAPEGWTVWGEDASQDTGGDTGRFPLLAPPPLHSSSYRVAMCPTGQSLNPVRYRGSAGRSRQPPRFIARCAECLRDRYCWSCHKWWCESCFPGTGGPRVMAGSTEYEAKAGVSKSCWECGNNCHECIIRTQRTCRRCCGGYCIIHNEGSDDTLCDWCSGRGRSVRELY